MSGLLLGVFASQSVTKEYFVASTTNTAPYAYAYPLNTSTGFGTKYADPATALFTGAYAVDWNPAGTVISISANASPYIHTYGWSSAGFGTKFANPASPPASGGYMAFSNDAVVVAQDSGGLVAYPFTPSSGYGTKYAGPSSNPSSGPGWPRFNDTFSFVGAGAGTPNIIAYPWNSTTGFGTKAADPASPPPSGSGSFNWNRAGSAAIVGYLTNSANYASGTGGVWAFSTSTGFGSKYANPASPIENYYGATGTGFNQNDTVVAVSQYSFNGTDRIAAWAWNNSTGFGTKFAAPATNKGDGRLMDWVPNGAAIAYIGNGGSASIGVYPWNNGFGTIFADPATPTSAMQNGVGVGQR